MQKGSLAPDGDYLLRYAVDLYGNYPSYNHLWVVAWATALSNKQNKILEMPQRLAYFTLSVA